MKYICVVIFCAIQAIACHANIVQVEQGSLSGELKNSILDGKPYHSFKGVPYAKPPTGKLRFQAPEEPETWEGIRDATVHGNVCPQYNPITAEFTPGSEDCLFLNVYSPNLEPDTPLPVVVFIHGGAYKFGSGDSSSYGPDFLVSQDVIVVTFNYRMDALGFLSFENEEAPGNAGLKDQVAVLKWVKKNIKKFGGDPNNVTIVGTTAGGTSVTYHMVSKMSAGLFNRAIAMSGAPSCDWAYPYQPRRRALLLTKLLGFDTDNTTAALDYLQGLSSDVLVNTMPLVLASETITDILFKMEMFTPTIEKDFGDKSFITEDPLLLLDSGKVNKVDAMFSYNSQEAVLLINLYNSSYIDLFNTYSEMFVPSELLVRKTPNEILDAADKIKDFYFGNNRVNRDNILNLVSYASNASIALHVQRFARRWPNVKNTYFFKFSSYSSRNIYGQQGAPYGINAAAHFDETFYMFNPEALGLPIEAGTVEYEMVQNIVKAITNFAKSGNPSPSSALGFEWPQFDKETKAYVNFANEMTVEYGPDDSDMEFWTGLYNSVGIKF